MNKIFTHMIRFYQRFFSPAAAALGAQCRFYPSCSEYAVEAFEKLPWWRALFLTISRLFRCHPWNEGGVDKVVDRGQGTVDRKTVHCPLSPVH